MALWEAPEVIESDEELIECAKIHGFYIYRKKSPMIPLSPCVCGRKQISTRVGKYICWDDYGSAKCWCRYCGLKAEVRYEDDGEGFNWVRLENETRKKWNDMIERIYKTQTKDVAK